MAALPTGQLYDPEMSAGHLLHEDSRVVRKPRAPPVMPSRVAHRNDQLASCRESCQRKGTEMVGSELPPEYSSV